MPNVERNICLWLWDKNFDSPAQYLNLGVSAYTVLLVDFCGENWS